MEGVDDILFLWDDKLREPKTIQPNPSSPADRVLALSEKKPQNGESLLEFQRD